LRILPMFFLRLVGRFDTPSQESRLAFVLENKVELEESVLKREVVTCVT
jgi:hypothetical protein